LQHEFFLASWCGLKSIEIHPLILDMDWLPPELRAGVLIAFGLASTLLLLFVLARWARRRSKGAVVAGALLSLFAPDPTLERNIRLAEEAKQVQSEEDEEGENQD